jgi:hypothetical protein
MDCLVPGREPFLGRADLAVERVLILVLPNLSRSRPQRLGEDIWRTSNVCNKDSAMLKSSAMEWKAKRQTIGNGSGSRPVDIPQGAIVLTATDPGTSTDIVTFQWGGMTLWLDADRFKQDFARRT